MSVACGAIKEEHRHDATLRDPPDARGCGVHGTRASSWWTRINFLDFQFPSVILNLRLIRVHFPVVSRTSCWSEYGFLLRKVTKLWSGPLLSRDLGSEGSNPHQPVAVAIHAAHLLEEHLSRAVLFYPCRGERSKAIRSASRTRWPGRSEMPRPMARGRFGCQDDCGCHGVI